MAEAIRGLEQMKRKLQELQVEARTGRKVLRAAFRQSANVIRDSARSKAPVKTGLLKRRIQTVSAKGKPGTIRFQVRANARKVSPKYPEGYPYGLAVEQGHGFPNSRQRQFKNVGEQEFGTGTVPPHPFMRPAWEESKEKALERFGEAAGEGIEKLAKE